MLRNINDILIKNKSVKIKIYSLNYYIKFENNSYTMYPENYEKNKYSSTSLEELFSNFYIYNESILDNLDRIKIVD